MTEEGHVWDAHYEPSAEDFEAAEHEAPPRTALARLSRAALIVVVVVALLLYFIVPAFRGAPLRWPLRDRGVHPLPVAPEPQRPPVLDV